MRLTLCCANKYLSQIFQPRIVSCRYSNNDVHDDDKTNKATSRSQKLLVENGLIRATSGTGLFMMMPLMTRAIERLVSIIEQRLTEVGAQKVIAPCLTPSRLWYKTGRLSETENSPEIIKVKDRHDKKYILSPTHEEPFTDLISSMSPVPAKQLPLKLYQIGPKFRDEMRPRFGIIRAREFIMKDLYTFDIDQNAAMETYKEISEVYEKIFKTIGIPFMKVEGDSGLMGGSISHEYHYESEIGEDEILECNNCRYRISGELAKNRQTVKCDRCKSECSDQFRKYSGLEVGHTFILGDRYSSILNAISTNKKPLQMCCFGLGITRILGTALEILSTDTQLKWPMSLAPYKVCIIGPKLGSKESDSANLVEELFNSLGGTCLKPDDIIIDDRNSLTIGKRLLEAKKFGYPFIIVVGKKSTDKDNPEYELITDEEDHVLNMENVIDMIRLKSHI